MVRRRTIEVSGMSCMGCERTVENALRNASGVHRVDADHEAGTVEVAVDEDVPEDDLTSTIREAGYDVAA